MSLEYCDKCDRMIDLDHDEHWEHFQDKWEEADNEYIKQMKGGKDNGKNN